MHFHGIIVQMIIGMMICIRFLSLNYLDTDCWLYSAFIAYYNHYVWTHAFTHTQTYVLLLCMQCVNIVNVLLCIHKKKINWSFFSLFVYRTIEQSSKWIWMVNTKTNPHTMALLFEVFVIINESVEEANKAAKILLIGMNDKIELMLFIASIHVPVLNWFDGKCMRRKNSDTAKLTKILSTLSMLRRCQTVITNSSDTSC